MTRWIYKQSEASNLLSTVVRNWQSKFHKFRKVIEQKQRIIIRLVTYINDISFELDPVKKHQKKKKEQYQRIMLWYN